MEGENGRRKEEAGCPGGSRMEEGGSGGSGRKAERWMENVRIAINRRNSQSIDVLLPTHMSRKSTSSLRHQPCVPQKLFPASTFSFSHAPQGKIEERVVFTCITSPWNYPRELLDRSMELYLTVSSAISLSNRGFAWTSDALGPMAVPNALPDVC